MTLQQLLPRTRSPVLLPAVILFSAACAYAATWVLWAVLFNGASPYALAVATVPGMLAYGVWTLKAFARLAALVILILALLITLFGVPGIFMESPTLSKGDVYIWVVPLALLECFCLYAFNQQKDAFAAKAKDGPN